MRAARRSGGVAALSLAAAGSAHLTPSPFAAVVVLRREKSGASPRLAQVPGHNRPLLARTHTGARVLTHTQVPLRHAPIRWGLRRPPRFGGKPSQSYGLVGSVVLRRGFYANVLTASPRRRPQAIFLFLGGLPLFGFNPAAGREASAPRGAPWHPCVHFGGTPSEKRRRQQELSRFASLANMAKKAQRPAGTALAATGGNSPR